jgi:hypothetical protein
MEFDLIADACNHGKEKGIPVRSGEEMLAINRQVRRALLGHE